MKNILIIDDNKDILKALKVGLCAHLKGCTILTAANGKEGEEILRSQPVDLVLADLDMPVMNGVHFVEQARKEHGSVPVCVMTGHCAADVHDRMRALGVKRVIGKPFEFDRLSNLIAEELGLEKRGSVWNQASRKGESEAPQ